MYKMLTYASDDAGALIFIIPVFAFGSHRKLPENIADWMNNLVQLPASDTIYLPFYWILRPDPNVSGCIFNGFGSCSAYLYICQPAVCECWLCLGLLSHAASAGLLF